MKQKISYLAAALLGAVSALVSVSSAACSLAPPDPVRIKQMMAKEIAFRLGVSPQAIPLAGISQPELHSPLSVEADCSGLATYHHSAGFRLGTALPVQARPLPGSRPWPRPRPRPPYPYPYPYPQPQPYPYPYPQPYPYPYPPRVSSVAQSTAPAAAVQSSEQCAYEGVAVVLGYGYTSPVAVHFERKCH